MTKNILIHNPRCSKSREAKLLLEDLKIEFEIVDYLKDGLKEKTLENLPKFLGLTFKEMIRKKEEIYKELNLGDKNLSNKEWIDVLRRHPILLERPIFICKDKAIIARPVELVKQVL